MPEVARQTSNSASGSRNRNPYARLAMMGVFSLLFFFTPLSSVIAQEEQRYVGPLTVKTYSGNADYGFTVVENDTLLDGPFELRRSNLDALIANTDTSFSFVGAFEDDYPVGNWEFRFGEFKSESETEVVGYQYRVKVSGTQHEASGALKKGKLDGPWTYTVKQIQNSELNSTLFNSSITFENGIPQQSFRIENENSTLVGRFLRNGLAHDVWTLFSDTSDTSESWFFSEGELKKIEKEKDGEVHTLIMASATANNSKTINLDERYSNILRLTQKEKDTSQIFEGGIQRLLAENIEYYQKLDDILSALGTSQFMPEFKVKVAYFPLDSVEIAQLDTIKFQYATSSKTASSFLESTQLNILRRSDEEAQKLYEKVETISREQLEPLKELVTYSEQDIFEFVSREHLIKRIWPVGLPKTRTSQVDGNTLTTVSQISQYASQSLDSIATVLNDKLLQESRQQELVEMEEQMIARTDHLSQRIDSLNGKASKLEKDALKNIQRLADLKLKEYSEMQDTGSKIDFGRKIMECLKHLDELADIVAMVPEQRETLQEKYQDAVWNPFMATIMNEEVKKRITTAYNNVLLPYLLTEAKSNLTCENAKTLGDTMTAAYQRVLEMRDENTAKLERKLRKERDPQMVMQLFNLKTAVED